LVAEEVVEEGWRSGREGIFYAGALGVEEGAWRLEVGERGSDEVDYCWDMERGKEPSSRAPQQKSGGKYNPLKCCIVSTLKEWKGIISFDDEAFHFYSISQRSNRGFSHLSRPSAATLLPDVARSFLTAYRYPLSPALSSLVAVVMLTAPAFQGRMANSGSDINMRGKEVQHRRSDRGPGDAYHCIERTIFLQNTIRILGI
jgi:hypothetical protein